VSKANIYFAYGSNLNRADMRVRCPSAKALSLAVLRDWRLTFRDVADIEPASGELVRGALWLVGEQDFRSLDRYEGAPSLYVRRFVDVETDDGPARAITYVMTSRDYLGLPSEWYLERIAQGYRDWGLPSRILAEAFERTERHLRDRGVELRRDGRKRLRGVVDNDG
jgi:gamma-glutamylcyclotransferase (GGCT)/AIG2-like uncharacterized protein YtfP